MRGELRTAAFCLAMWLVLGLVLIEIGFAFAIWEAYRSINV